MVILIRNDPQDLIIKLILTACFSRSEFQMLNSDTEIQRILRTMNQPRSWMPEFQVQKRSYPIAYLRLNCLSKWSESNASNKRSLWWLCKQSYRWQATLRRKTVNAVSWSTSCTWLRSHMVWIYGVQCTQSPSWTEYFSTILYEFQLQVHQFVIYHDLNGLLVKVFNRFLTD